MIGQLDEFKGYWTLKISIETQAIARAVRLGQKNNVIIQRYLMKDTIEEKLYNDYKSDAI